MSPNSWPGAGLRSERRQQTRAVLSEGRLPSFGSRLRKCWRPHRLFRRHQEPTTTSDTRLNWVPEAEAPAMLVETPQVDPQGTADAGGGGTPRHAAATVSTTEPTNALRVRSPQPPSRRRRRRPPPHTPSAVRDRAASKHRHPARTAGSPVRYDMPPRAIMPVGRSHRPAEPPVGE